VEERQSYREILAINRAIASAEAYDAILQLVVERTAAFTSATACMLILAQEDGLARVVRSVGIDPAKAAELAVPLTERIDRELCLLLSFKSPDQFLGVPVIGKEGLRGLLAVYWEGPEPVLDAAYTEELLSALADQAAIALDNAERVRRSRASEEKLASLISIAADAIISVDEAQRIVMFNEGAEKIFGWSRDEVLGKPLDLLIPERFRVIHRQHVRSFGAGRVTARKMGETHSAIFGLRKSGEEFPADAAISKLHDDGGRLYTAVLRDVTEQRRTESEQRFLSEVGAILSSSLDYEETLTSVARLAVRDFADICIVDLLEESGEARRLRTVSRDPALDWACEILTTVPFDRTRPHLVRPPLDAKGPVLIRDLSSEDVALFAQNEERLRALRAIDPKSLILVPLLAREQIVGVIAFVSSTPSRKYGSQDLQLAGALAQRAALAIENARLYRAAHRAIQVRDDVLGIVAHDLRNPLNSILMQVELMQRRGGEPERRSQNPVNRLRRSAARMDRMIQDLLDVARMEAGSLRLERDRVSAGQVVADIVDVQKPLVADASLDLRLDVGHDVVEVWADRDRLHQIFENLIGNAIKFTAAGGSITVGAAQRDGEALFWVTDTGAGISAENLPHVFDRFWQARKGERRGAGLGLAIVKGLVEAHGGRIWVESTLGQGTTFFFTVPTAPGPSA
jgi:PAS domain S-box-containing protein